MKIIRPFLGLLLLAGPTWAQETAPVFETVVEDVVFNTSNRVILDEKLIKDSRAPDITTLLSSQANITIANRPYQPNSIFIRGSDAAHILILVDGIPFYDASTSQRTFNLNSMDIKSVRHIEIIKGAQTTLYGGQALGGVIKIETLPDSLESKSGLQVRAGQFDLSDAAVSSVVPTFEDQAVFVRAQAGQFKTESPLIDSSKMYGHQKSNAEASYIWRGPVKAYLKAHYLDEENDFPELNRITNAIEDSNDSVQRSKQLAITSALRFSEVAWNPQLSMGAQNSSQQYDVPGNPPAPVGHQDYVADLKTIRLDVTPWKSELYAVQLGVSYIHENFVYRNAGAEQANNFSEQRGIFAKVDYQLAPAWNFSVGGRLENWSDKDPVSTYQAGLTLYQNTKLEVATGYKIPSPFQLYSAYGNLDLQEERSLQYSATQDFPVNENQTVSLTGFISEYSNLIIAQGAQPNTQYQNVTKSKTQGIELSYSLRATPNSSLLVTYGYQEPKDIDNNRWLPLRSLVNGSVRYTHTLEAHTATLEVLAAGERLDRGLTGYGTLPGYATANASYSYNWNENLALYTRLNNLMNTRYQESNGYYSQSFTAQAGADYWS